MERGQSPPLFLERRLAILGLVSGQISTIGLGAWEKSLRAFAGSHFA